MLREMGIISIALASDKGRIKEAQEGYIYIYIM